MQYFIKDFMHLKHENLGFTVDRPNGSDDYIFLHFINPVDIQVSGHLLRTAPNACIIYSPGTPHYYRAVSHELFHNWTHFMPMDKESNPLYSGIPLNKLFYTEHGNTISKIMEDIQWLYNQKNTVFMSAYFSKIILLLKDEQSIHKKSTLYSSSALFDELRQLIYQTPKNWNIKSMAEYVHLSPSRFSIKYKSIFGVTPVEDLGNAAIGMAIKLLTTTFMDIQNISLECGYKSISFFYHKFKEKTGVTPLEYRNLYKT